MNARDNTPLRTLIADRLAAGEDTAAGIAQAIGKGDTPSIVVKELNAMRTDGQVECEQRGKKKELVYWLAVPLEVAAGNVAAGSPDDLAPAIISESVLPAGMRQGTRRLLSRRWYVLRLQVLVLLGRLRLRCSTGFVAQRRL